MTRRLDRATAAQHGSHCACARSPQPRPNRNKMAHREGRDIGPRTKRPSRANRSRTAFPEAVYRTHRPSRGEQGSHVRRLEKQKERKKERGRQISWKERRRLSNRHRNGLLLRKPPRGKGQTKEGTHFSSRLRWISSITYPPLTCTESFVAGSLFVLVHFAFGT